MPRPFDVAGIADFATQRLVRISERASRLARGVGLLAAAAGALAYVVGLVVFPSSFRLWWALAGIVVCGAPGVAVFLAIRRLRRVRTTITETSAELRALGNDREVRAALLELVDRDEDHETTTPLIKLGTELNTLRKAVSGHRSQLVNAWKSVTALTTLPGLVALATVTTLALFAFSAIAVVVRLVLLAA